MSAGAAASHAPIDAARDASDARHTDGSAQQSSGDAAR
jgi:GTP cyclohydrolase III